MAAVVSVAVAVAVVVALSAVAALRRPPVPASQPAPQLPEGVERVVAEAEPELALVAVAIDPNAQLAGAGGDPQLDAAPGHPKAEEELDAVVAAVAAAALRRAAPLVSTIPALLAELEAMLLEAALFEAWVLVVSAAAPPVLLVAALRAVRLQTVVVGIVREGRVPVGPGPRAARSPAALSVAPLPVAVPSPPRSPAAFLIAAVPLAAEHSAHSVGALSELLDPSLEPLGHLLVPLLTRPLDETLEALDDPVDDPLSRTHLALLVVVVRDGRRGGGPGRVGGRGSARQGAGRAPGDQREGEPPEDGQESRLELGYHDGSSSFASPSGAGRPRSIPGPQGSPGWVSPGLNAAARQVFALRVRPSLCQNRCMAPVIECDFRSDTVTVPTAAMRRAMADAEVGDDVFGDDPGALRLEAEAARLFGKEAALFCPSGTMANLLAILCQARPGEEVLCEERSHSYRFEQAGAARFGGVQLRGLAGDDAGRLAPSEVEAALVGGPDAPFGVRLHCARTALVLLENTHNFSGGRVQPIGLLEETYVRCHARGVRVHLDGARLMNAVVASGVSAARYAAAADTVMCSLSKGLSAPIGSVLCGPAETIEQARIVRKALGGGMRQVGVLCAPGLLALGGMVERLLEDHRLARRLAEGLAGLPGAEVDPEAVETNILFVRLAGGASAHRALHEGLAARGVGCAAVGEYGVRFVTHRGVGEADVERALEAAAEVLAA